MKLGRILVPLDGSALAEAALSSAVSLARPDTELMLIRAAEAFTVPGADPTEGRLVLEHKIGAVPVMDAGQLAGIVAETDLLRVFVRGGLAEPGARGRARAT